MTQLGNIIKLISMLLVVAGFKPFTDEEANAIIVVVGLAGELIGFAMSWFGRYRKGDVKLNGFYKDNNHLFEKRQ